MSGLAPSRARHTAVGFTLALAAIAYLDRICISTAAPAIRAELGLGDAEMGFVFSAFTLAYAIFEIPTGYWGDRIGTAFEDGQAVMQRMGKNVRVGFSPGYELAVVPDEAVAVGHRHCYSP